MSKDVYNLQIPISKELEAQLRELAEIDERTIRVFRRRILQKYVDENLGRLKDAQTTDAKDSYTPGEDVEGFDWSLDD